MYHAFEPNNWSQQQDDRVIFSTYTTELTCNTDVVSKQEAAGGGGEAAHHNRERYSPLPAVAPTASTSPRAIFSLAGRGGAGAFAC